MASISPYASKEAWAATIERAFNNPESELEGTILSLYAKDVTITVNGNVMKWDTFLPDVKEIRARTASVRVTSHHFLRDGKMFAERHTVIGTGIDGSERQVEAMCIGQLDDEGKAIWQEEITRLVGTVGS
jgi:hypothetical protein